MIERQALSVTQVNLYIKELMNCNDILTDIMVKGEISNFKAHSSGHLYMSLKDEGGVMRAVMFRSAASKLNFTPQNGMKIVARGRVSVYERDGQYQLYVDSMQQDGIGDLYVAFEKLKQKLSQEGLFNPEHKQKLPRYPKKIGIVTAPTGAAIRDIINVLSRRFSYSDIVLYPVLVQGENSAESIVKAIEYFNNADNIDVMIVGRGGGSIEDLWSFNEEIVARAIYNSHIPIISAVGHEIDFTIADFVADMRAPTPSAAAEIAVPSQIELKEKFNNVYNRLYSQANRVLERGKLQIRSCTERPAFKNPLLKIGEERIYLDRVYHDLETTVDRLFDEKKQQLKISVSKLDGLSPLGALARGFSVAKDGENKVIKSVKQVAKNDKIEITVEDGKISATVDETRIV